MSSTWPNPIGSSGAGIEVRIEGLEKRFSKGGHTIEVLRGLDLTLTAGDRVAVVGQSGSGKSTFLHILGTLDRPSAGRIGFGARDVFARAPAELDALRNREIGFQFHHLLLDHDALGNVAMPAMIGGMSGARARAEAAALLERVGLGGRLHHRPGELSGGEQQRVAIARALVRRPGLILADEPTGNLDPTTASAVFDLFLELNAEVGSTLVVVTHDRRLADRFPRVLELEGGRFIEHAGAQA